MIKQGKSGAVTTALYILFSLVALLVVVNGVILLCETDPAQFYSRLFG
jgi:hypothetical protein